MSFNPSAFIRRCSSRTHTAARVALVLLLLRYLIGCNVASAIDAPGWPHLRGPNYAGVSSETGLLDAWPAEGPPVLWTADLGQGYSGFCTFGNRVCTQSQSLFGQYVICLDADTGERVWEHRYDLPFEPAGVYPGPRATPTYHEQRIYFAGPSGLVGCLNAGDGQPLWSMNVNERFGGRGTGFGYSCSPLVEDGKVILPVGGENASVVALDAGTGATVWAAGSEPASYCSAVPITVGDRRLVVAYLQNALAIFDLRTGEQVWQQRFSQGYNEHAALPVYEAPYLFVSSPFRDGARAYRVEPDDQASVAVSSAWDNRELSNDVASSLALAGHVYGFDLRDMQSKAQRPSRGEFRCLDLSTGEVRWSTGVTGHACVIAADGKLILFNDRGEVLLARATPDSYQELARAPIVGDEICWTAPALDRRRLYLRSPSRAVCLYLGDPSELQAEQQRQALPASQLPQAKRQDLAWLLGGEREFAFDLPDVHELAVWYWFCVGGVFAPAGVIAAAAFGLRCIRTAGDRRWPTLLFWIASLILGATMSPVYNRYTSEFVFTWPASVFAVYHVTLRAIVWAEQQSDKRRARRVSRLAGLALLVICAGYFYLCRRLSLVHEWAFLIGFIPAWPIAVLTAKRPVPRPSAAWDAVAVFVTFSCYYWGSAGFLLWKSLGPAG